MYVTMYRSVLICVNYRVKHQYLTYRRVTLRNGHVRENKSIYRVCHVEWNSVIAALQRRRMMPLALQYSVPRTSSSRRTGRNQLLHRTDTVVRSACQTSRYKHSLLRLQTCGFGFGILLPKRT